LERGHDDPVADVFERIAGGLGDLAQGEPGGLGAHAEREIILGQPEERVGDAVDVLVDGNDGTETVGRAEHQGPEVDGECILTDQGSLVLGDLVRCRVIAAKGVDLVVEPMELIALAGGEQ
jgi:hypothetical protein